MFVLNILQILGLTCFTSNWIEKKIKKISEIKVLQNIKNDVVANFNDVIRITGMFNSALHVLLMTYLQYYIVIKTYYDACLVHVKLRFRDIIACSH